LPLLIQKTQSDNQIPFIPWNTEASWREANDSIEHLVVRHVNELPKARGLAQSILIEMFGVFMEMNRLCSDTCPKCNEPCCRVATLWFDYKDLIFLHLNSLGIAAAQPVDHYGDICRYLGERGCNLRREERPFICTLYLCPAQTSRLRRKSRLFYREFNMKLSVIKNRRKKLEDEFIQSIV